jgi:hypothetical protein
LIDVEIILAAISAGASIPLKIFFALVEAAVIWAGIYFFRNREKFFSHKKGGDDTYASANLRMVMVVLIWIHSVIVGAIMIFEV